MAVNDIRVPSEHLRVLRTGGDIRVTSEHLRVLRTGGDIRVTSEHLRVLRSIDVSVQPFTGWGIPWQ